MFLLCFSLKDLLQNMGDNFTADEVSFQIEILSYLALTLDSRRKGRGTERREGAERGG